PIDDTPAYRAGLLSGDRIVKIDGELTRGITLIEAVKKLRGKPKTQVNLTILREQDATAELKEVTLERDVIKIESVKEARILEDHVGYIRLTDFREKTSPDLEKALRRLVEDQMDALILDLRNNPGGLLDTAVSVAELFLDRNQVIVTTRGRNKSQNQDFRARRDGMIHSMPLVVLINEGSASASEIVAGAVQDHGRGIIMGIKSHGKASVQTIFPLKDGSALRLTTSKYFTPKGRSIHGSGIVPDVEIPLEKPAVKAEEQDKTQRGEEVFEQLEKKDGAAQPDAKKPEWDNQLHRALDLLKALKVYQGREKHKVVSRVPYDDLYSRY
ncbi:MAG: S41 family peptidase, partial [Candidatus Omnitrophica bacterium]|nr:S41 family peptidase [Candidatus Omnitrophota bacterium]